jgi:TonB family protein
MALRTLLPAMPRRDLPALPAARAARADRAERADRAGVLRAAAIAITALLAITLSLVAPRSADASDTTDPRSGAVAADPMTAQAALPKVDAPPPAGPSVADRLAAIQARVESMLVYPALAQRRGIEGETAVEFSIDARGHARDVATRQSSGSPALDRAAERAVREAAPLPFVYGRLVIPVRFALDPR